MASKADKKGAGDLRAQLTELLVSLISVSSAAKSAPSNLRIAFCLCSASRGNIPMHDADRAVAQDCSQSREVNPSLRHVSGERMP